MMKKTYMQIVTLDQLKELAKKPIAESDLPGQKTFDEIVKTHEQSYTAAKSKRMHENDAMQAACSAVKRFVHFNLCPPVRLVGEGSSRIAFALDGGLCVKVAKNLAGKAQNKAEFKICVARPSFFPVLYDKDKDFAAILVECCAPFTYRDRNEFKKMIGFELSDPDYISIVLDKADRHRQENFEETYKSCLQDAINDMKNAGESDTIAYVETIYAILNPTNQAQELLRKLALWCFVNPHKIDVADFGNIENWGAVARKGQLVPIVLDVGFSPEVRDEFY